MKILLLADINSTHTQKWASSLRNNGITLGIFSLSTPNPKKEWDTTGIEIFNFRHGELQLNQNTTYSKVSYLKVIPYLKKIIADFSPDIIHAHYASSYGLIGALTKFHPYIMSAWGSDVMEFPKKSFLHRKTLQYTLKHADTICVTSKILEKEISHYTSKKTEIIPFGIDCDFFSPTNDQAEIPFTIGTTKALETIYGIDIAIKAFSAFHEKHPDLKKKLMIIGDGSQRNTLERLTKQLNIEQITFFAGHQPIAEMPSLLNQIHVLVNVSHNESFGVSVLEASACEKCIVATNVGGLPEVVEDNVTGLLIQPDNADELFKTLDYLYLNPEKRIELGKNGRTKVLKEYDFKDAISRQIGIYGRLLNRK